MDAIKGHTKVKKLLNDTINSGKIGHAYIFEGKAGVGRLSLAKAFAKMACGSKSHLTVENNPDIIVVTNELYDPKKTQTNVLVDTIRSMKADVYIRPYLSDRKFYIIPNADTMQAPAQNSLLKVFEEPPEYCTIILIAENANLFLQTIRSRANLIKIPPLSTEEVESYIREEKGADDKSAKAVAVMSGGSIGRALMLLEEGEAAELRDEIMGHLMKLQSGKYEDLYGFIKFLKQNKTSFDMICQIMSEWSSDILHLKILGKCDIINVDKADELKKFSLSVTKEAAFKLGEIITKYSLAVKRNTNYPIAVSCMAMEYWEEING